MFLINVIRLVWLFQFFFSKLPILDEILSHHKHENVNIVNCNPPLVVLALDVPPIEY